ncbi:MAG: hypothetical protein LUF33_01215 [Clostridiales bacterium]|nr:hypothetical protein [Clostridiales bacterium]
MRFIVSEIFKLFSKRIFLACLVISLLANAFFIVYSQSSDTVNSAIADNNEEYDDFISECLSQDNAAEFIESKQKEIQIAIFLENTSTSDDTDAEYIENQKKSYSEESPEEYRNALELDLSNDERQARLIMIQDLASQLEYIDGYDEFIAEMEARAENQKSFSIFSDSSSFSFRNIEETPKDFEHLKDIELTIGNSKALEASTRFQLTDYLVLILVVLMCITLFCLEREKGLYSLVRSTKHGRTATILSKLFVVIAVTALLCIVFYACDFVVCGALFGFGDLSRNIQSSEIFMNCSLNVSIMQYIILWIAGKLILFCSFALFLSFVFVAVKTSAKVYALIVAFLFAEFFTYLFIDGNSVFGFLKYVNFVYLMIGNNIFGYYQNVSLFSYPVNIVTVFTVSAAVMITVGILGSCIIFSKFSQLTGKSLILTKLSNAFEKRSRISGSVRVFSGEAFKHYKTSFAFIVLAVLAVFGFFNLTDDLTIVYSSAEESAYSEYMKTLEGELDEEKYEFLENEQQYFDDLANRQIEIANDTSLSETEREAKQSSVQSIIETKGKAFSLICEQVAYAESKAEEIGEPPALIDEIINKRLTQDTFREWEYFTLLLAVVIFCTSNIFACEYKRSMINLIRANKHGKARLLLTKLFIVLLTSVISFVLIYLPYFINFVQTFGTTSFDLPLAFVRDFGMLSSSITVLEYVCVLGALHFSVAITATALIYMLSYLLKNNAVTLIISSGIFLVPCLVAIRNDTMRTAYFFKSNIWLLTVILVLILCVCVTAASITVTFIKFNNVKRRNNDAES